MGCGTSIAVENQRKPSETGDLTLISAYCPVFQWCWLFYFALGFLPFYFSCTPECKPSLYPRHVYRSLKMYAHCYCLTFLCLWKFLNLYLYKGSGVNILWASRLFLTIFSPIPMCLISCWQAQGAFTLFFSLFNYSQMCHPRIPAQRWVRWLSFPSPPVSCSLQFKTLLQLVASC